MITNGSGNVLIAPSPSFAVAIRERHDTTVIVPATRDIPITGGILKCEYPDRTIVDAVLASKTEVGIVSPLTQAQAFELCFDLFEMEIE